jgi:hypothetical protein
MFVYWNKADNTFWSNEDGWVDIESATHFTREEINQFKHVPEGGSPLELIKKFYEIIGVTDLALPTTYRGEIYSIPGIGACYLALEKEMGDLADWFDDEELQSEMRQTHDDACFELGNATYSVRISDETFAHKLRSYALNVDVEDLKKQIKTLSKLTEHLSDDEYTNTIGAVEVLEEIVKQAENK